MDYALIENGNVTNIIWLHPGNIDDFPNAVPMNDVPAAIGDSYADGGFYRNGERVLSAAEQMQAEMAKQEAVLENLIGGVEDVRYE